MEKKINSTGFKKHLLLSYIYDKKNCKKFDDFIKLISTTEEEVHKLIIDLMKSGYVIYENDGYQVNEELLLDYNYFIFVKSNSYTKDLKNINKDAIIYLPKSFLNKMKK